MKRSTALSLGVVMACFGVAAFAQKAPVPLDTDRGLFRTTQDGIEELYVFPLFGSKTELTFVSCPFVALSDGGEGTACHFETLSGAGGMFLNAKRSDVAGCAIEDHWNIDCPDFTAEGFTFSNANKLAEIVRDRVQASGHSTNIAPVVRDASNTGAASAGQLDVYRNRHFEVVGECAAYASNHALEQACIRGLDALAPGPDILGAMALTAGPYGFVCLVSADWSIPACSLIANEQQ